MSKEVHKTSIGGQAVMEGIMMRHGDRCSIAVRKEDGTITVKNDNYVPLRKKYKICNLPILRGAINMVEMLMLSVRTLNDSVEMLGLEEELESEKKSKAKAKKAESIEPADAETEEKAAQEKAEEKKGFGILEGAFSRLG